MLVKQNPATNKDYTPWPSGTSLKNSKCIWQDAFDKKSKVHDKNSPQTRIKRDL